MCVVVMDKLDSTGRVIHFVKLQDEVVSFLKRSKTEEESAPLNDLKVDAHAAFIDTNGRLCIPNIERIERLGWSFARGHHYFHIHTKVCSHRIPLI